MSTTAQASPLAALSEAGVSIWLDDLGRGRLTSGSLARDVAERHIVGVTTNPSIFAAAVKGADEYAEQLGALARAGADVESAVTRLTTDDVRRAADVLRGVYDATGSVDGRVSIEVDPRLAHDTAATVRQARALWRTVDRPNVLIKIPATEEGLPAISQVLGEGISVNVTLIFALERYGEVIDAFMDGLDRARAAGHDLAPIGSVASFFVSRVDSAVDAHLAADSPLRGAAAIANARLAYELYEARLSSARWVALEAAGAHPQRPLWASTSVKDPAYPDTMYVDELVTRGVVNTMPQGTIDAVEDHGTRPGDPSSWDTVRGTGDEARRVMSALAVAGVDMDAVTARLETEGVEKFIASWEELLGTVRDALARA